MITLRKPTIGISLGDFNGIGPEIILKTLLSTDPNQSTSVIFSPPEIIRFYNTELGLNGKLHLLEKDEPAKNGIINIAPIASSEVKITPGIQTAESGEMAMRSIDEGITQAMKGLTDAIVTAPISKEAVNLAGYKIPGHTEHLASRTNTDTVVMMLVNESLRVALATTHVPVKNIVNNITGKSLTDRLKVLDQSLKKDFGIENPEIAVFGLNPHAGDGGVIGFEEIELIEPLIERLNKQGLNLKGPFPADGFFGRKLHLKHDAVFAMYHDQGLVPFKLLSFGKGVNFTAGLPIIRTSPDHGTAFDIAGQGIANPSSFKQAFHLAVKLAINKIHAN